MIITHLHREYTQNKTELSKCMRNATQHTTKQSEIKESEKILPLRLSSFEQNKDKKVRTRQIDDIFE